MIFLTSIVKDAHTRMIRHAHEDKCFHLPAQKIVVVFMFIYLWQSKTKFYLGLLDTQLNLRYIYSNVEMFTCRYYWMDIDVTKFFVLQWRGYITKNNFFQVSSITHDFFMRVKILSNSIANKFCLHLFKFVFFPLNPDSMKINNWHNS